MRSLSPFDWVRRVFAGPARPVGGAAFPTHPAVLPEEFGEMSRPDGHAKITGPCGDTMEFWLRIADGCIAEATYVTDGCGSSILSGYGAVRLAKGRALESAANIGQQEVLDAIGGLPPDSEHCALLASTTLQTALEDYRQAEKTEG